jgi:hypothetical protein
LYKGNDISEASLAAIEAIALLKKYFPAAAQLLAGIDNSAVDVGILALRKSMLDALGAKTAAHVGLKGGYNGSVWATDAALGGAGSIEIYPWMVSQDGSIDRYKDTEWLVQQEGNAATPAQIKLNRKLSQGYLGVALPSRSASIFRLKMVSPDTMALVKCDDAETPVTYQMCVDLLGFDSASTGAPASLSAPVEYKIVRNLDGQNHVHKGAFGVRYDELEEGSIVNVAIEDCETTEARPAVKGLGSDAQQVAFGVNHAHEPQSDVLRITGVSLNACENVEVENVVIKMSEAGSEIYGVEVAGQSEKIEVEAISAETISGPELATVLRVSGNTKEVKAKEISGTGLVAQHAGLAPIVKIESASAKLN